MTMMVSNDTRQPVIPNFLYTTTHSASPVLTHGGFRILSPNNTSLFRSTTSSPAKLHHYKNLMIPAPDEAPFHMYVGGFSRFGIPHLLATPCDLIKCKMQIHPANWNWRTVHSGIEKGQGRMGLLVGYHYNLMAFATYGAFKIGFYDSFKKYYSDIAGPEYAAKHKTLINVVSSASAEVIASIILCPMEVAKIRVQTQPGFETLSEAAIPKLYRTEGAHGLYKGLLPLWGRQIPYTMMQFALFEGIEKMLYKIFIPKPKHECSPRLQASVIYAAGFATAVPCAIVSHPADTLFTFLNSAKGATVGDAVKKFGLWGLCNRGLGIRMILLGPFIVLDCGLSLMVDEFKKVNTQKVDEFEQVNLDGDGTSNTGGVGDVWVGQYFD